MSEVSPLEDPRAVLSAARQWLDVFVRACDQTISQQKTALARAAMSKTLGFDLWW